MAYNANHLRPNQNEQKRLENQLKTNARKQKKIREKSEAERLAAAAAIVPVDSAVPVQQTSAPPERRRRRLTTARERHEQFVPDNIRTVEDLPASPPVSTTLRRSRRQSERRRSRSEPRPRRSLRAVIDDDDDDDNNNNDEQQSHIDSHPHTYQELQQAASLRDDPCDKFRFETRGAAFPGPTTLQTKERVRRLVDEKMKNARVATCAACAQRKPSNTSTVVPVVWPQLSVLKPYDQSIPPLALQQYQHHTDTNGIDKHIVLERGGLLRANGTALAADDDNDLAAQCRLCQQCFTDLNDKQCPLEALANGFLTGQLPPQFADTTPKEFMCVQLTRPRATITKVRGGTSHRVNQILFFAAEPMPLSMALPRPWSEEASVAIVCFSSAFTREERVLSLTRYRVRRQRVYDLLVWLKANNVL